MVPVHDENWSVFGEVATRKAVAVSAGAKVGDDDGVVESGTDQYYDGVPAAESNDDSVPHPYQVAVDFFRYLPHAVDKMGQVWCAEAEDAVANGNFLEVEADRNFEDDPIEYGLCYYCWGLFDIRWCLVYLF